MQNHHNHVIPQSQLQLQLQSNQPQSSNPASSAANHHHHHHHHYAHQQQAYASYATMRPALSYPNHPPPQHQYAGYNHNSYCNHQAPPMTFSQPPPPPQSSSSSSSSGTTPSHQVKPRKVTPPKAPPAASASRRSERKRKSTLVYVDGHAVLRQNNYEVKGGEYVHGHVYSNAPRPSKRTRVDRNHGNIMATKTPNTEPAPRVVSAHEVQRKHHNARVQAVVRQNEGLRWNFLGQHVDLLQHFCEPKVLADLKNKNSSNRENYSIYQPLDLLTEAPKAVQATLRDYQLQGLTFMANMHNQNLSMILGDEMGLGKTLQTISFLCWLKENRGVTGPSLVICPLSVLSSWCKEMAQWAPTLKFFRMHASSPTEQMHQKHELTTNACHYDVILTTYEMAKVPLMRSFYSRLHFNYLVLDEGHKIKGHETQIAQAVRSIHAGNQLILTGTPLQNNMVELWSLLQFLYPAIFTTSEPFAKAFCLAENVIDKGFLQQSHQLLNLFMLRRLKQKVETFIPAKLETKVYCPLSKTQSFWYRSLLMKDLSKLASAEDQGSDALEGNAQKHTVLKSLFMQLRKCCNHPFVFDGAEMDPGQTTLEELVAASGKLSVLDMLLQRLFRDNHRAVVFSQFTSILDIIEDYCRLRGWKYCRLDGSTERARRSYYINRFNEPDSPFFLFLVSTRSGGMGLNLQTADTCILFDSDWNPQSDIQAMGRVHRIGQTKTVHVYRLVSSGTVEERMLQRAEKKLLLEMVNQESKESGEDERVRGLSAAELLEDIKFGSQAVFGDSANNELPSWQDIDTITDRERKESDSVGKLHGNKQHSAKEFDAEKAFGETQTFGGIDFRAVRKQQEDLLKSKIPQNLKGIGNLWQEISQLKSKRERKNRIMMVESNGSGYGKPVPVLKSNDYDLENGESSVFDRELKKDRKAKFKVAKKKVEGPTFDNQDFCQVCGDGGSLVCCGRCPCSVHLKCVGLKRAKDFLACTHHRCTGCGKNRQCAGGLLYPCQACPNAYCEDCLPKNGVTYLENVPRFDALKFDSANSPVVYIICSNQCRAVAKQEFGYVQKPSNGGKRKCLRPLDVSFGFGATKSLEAELSELQKEQKEQETGTNSTSEKVRRGGRIPSKIESLPQIKKNPDSNSCEEYRRWKALPISERAIEKVCLSTGKVLDVCANFKDAFKNSRLSPTTLYDRLRKQSPSECDGFLWKLTTVCEAGEQSVAKGNDSCATTASSSISSDSTSSDGKLSPPNEETSSMNLNEAQPKSPATSLPNEETVSMDEAQPDPAATCACS
ncbi:unnamed protein product [Cylindrotheca closterium]|uniref:Uncharacterized protein n=1 Tax=Cylindrotheca closterium TaxID=2856 RepID=A0AAD2CKL0_9STRA|nr:unnamed protein product [Cylindrotheca closterium]